MDISSQLREKRQKDRQDQRSFMYVSAAMQQQNVAAMNEKGQRLGEAQVHEGQEGPPSSPMTFRADEGGEPDERARQLSQRSRDWRQPNLENVSQGKFQNYSDGVDVALSQSVGGARQTQVNTNNYATISGSTALKRAAHPLTASQTIENGPETAQGFLFDSTDERAEGVQHVNFYSPDPAQQIVVTKKAKPRKQERPLYDREKVDVFNNKFKDLQDLKPKKVTFSPDVMEHWLNGTLDEAANLEIPGCLLNPDNQLPLARYNVSKDELIAEGIEGEKVNGIHRALFAHSFGFFQMLQTYVQNTQNPNMIKNNLWRVFTILLEYCSKTNYQMLIRSLHLMHAKELNDATCTFKKMIGGLEALHEKTSQELRQQHADNGALRKELEEQERLNAKFEEELERSHVFHEEEVQIRRTIMERLNILYAMHRNLQGVYEKAKQEIYETSQTSSKRAIDLEKHVKSNLQGKVELEKNRQLIEQLRNDLDFANKKLESKQDEIDHLAGEKWKYENKAKELEYTLNAQDEVYEALKRKGVKSDMDIQEQEKTIKNLRSQVADEKAQQKLFYGKFNEANEKLLEITQKWNELDRHNKTLEAVQKDRDERIKATRAEMMELIARKDEIETSYASLKSEHESTLQTLEHERKHSQQTQERFDMVYEENRKQEAAITKLNFENRSYQTKDQEKQDKIEELEKAKTELRLDFNQLKLKLQEREEAMQKEKTQHDEYRTATTNKLAENEEAIAVLQQTNEAWQQKHDNEEQNHAEVREELLALRTEEQMSKIALRNMKNDNDARGKALQRLEDEKEAALTKSSTYKQEIQELTRTLYSLRENLENLESQNRADRKQTTDERAKLIAKIRRTTDRSEMTMEDNLAQTLKMDQMVITLTNKCEDADVKLMEEAERYAVLRQEYHELAATSEQLQEELKKAQEERQEEHKDNETFQKKMFELNKQVKELEQLQGVKDQYQSERVARIESEETIQQLREEMDTLQFKLSQQQHQIIKYESLPKEVPKPAPMFNKSIQYSNHVVDAHTQTDAASTGPGVKKKERENNKQLAAQENLFMDQLNLQGLLGKGIHTQLGRMKQLLQMKEMQKKQDLDKALKAERLQGEPKTEKRLSERKGESVEKKETVPSQKSEAPKQPPPPKVEKPKTKIKKRELNTGEYDLFAHMARLSNKNQENIKPAFVPSPEKKDVSIEDIQKRDKQRERDQQDGQSDWRFRRSGAADTLAPNSSGDRRAWDRRASSRQARDDKATISSNSRLAQRPSIAHQTIPKETGTAHSTILHVTSNPLSKQDGQSQNQKARASQRGSLIQIVSPSEKEASSRSSAARKQPGVKKNVYQTIGSNNYGSKQEQRTASSIEGSQQLETARQPQPPEETGRVFQLDPHLNDQNMITLKNKGGAETSMSTSMDQVKSFAAPGKQSAQDPSQMATSLVIQAKSKQVPAFGAGADALKTQFRQGLFDARPQTGNVGAQAPLSERNGAEPGNLLTNAVTDASAGEQAVQKNVGLLLADPEPQAKKTFRIRQSLQDVPLSEAYKESVLVNFNHDVLKSVYELRQQHEALVSRPVTSQPFSARRRNLKLNCTSQKFIVLSGPSSPTDCAPWQDNTALNSQRNLYNLQQPSQRPKSFYASKGHKSELKNAARQAWKQPVSRGNLKSSQKSMAGVNPAKGMTPSMNPRVQHAYRYRGRRPQEDTSEIQSPRLETETNERALQRRSQIVGVSGKSVPGKVADHGNYQYSSTMGSTTQRDLARTTGRDMLQGFLNTARTGSMVLVSGGPESHHRPSETQSPPRGSFDMRGRRTKGDGLKHQIKQGEINRLDPYLDHLQ